MSTPSPNQVTSLEETATPRAAGSKRKLPDDMSMSDEEVKRLRDKNRTNSKRFRDRKKSYMDGLFEEKYRLGKSNNDLRDDNEKLRRLLEEAMLENQRHKRNAALGLYNFQSAARIPPPPTNGSSLLGMSHLPLSTRSSPLADVARLQHHSTRIENELLALRKAPLATASSIWSKPCPTTVLDYLEDTGARKRAEQLRQDLVLRDLETSIAAKMMTSHHQPNVGLSQFHRGQRPFL